MAHLTGYALCFIVDIIPMTTHDSNDLCKFICTHFVDCHDSVQLAALLDSFFDNYKLCPCCFCKNPRKIFLQACHLWWHSHTYKPVSWHEQQHQLQTYCQHFPRHTITCFHVGYCSAMAVWTWVGTTTILGISCTSLASLITLTMPLFICMVWFSC